MNWELKEEGRKRVFMVLKLYSALNFSPVQSEHCFVFCFFFYSIFIFYQSIVDFFGRNDAKAETPVLWPPHAESWLIGKDSDAGRDWGQEEKGMTEDEMAGWHHWLDRRESEWTPGVGDGQGGLACWDSWGRKESDTTEWLIWSDTWFGASQVA